MQLAILDCLSQGIEAQLNFAMLEIFGNDQRIVEKDTLCLGLAYIMFLRTLAAVAVVPFEPEDLVDVQHVYTTIVYKTGIRCKAS